jgi:hypothetical protein
MKSKTSTKTSALPRKVYTWLWHSWLRAQYEAPVLRWLGLTAVLVAFLAAALASAQGDNLLTALVYGGTVFLFTAVISAISYLLSRTHHRHRWDSIYASKRMTDLIRKIAREEIRAKGRSWPAREFRPGLSLPLSEKDMSPMLFLHSDGSQRLHENE